jgi:hypothetical protein
MTRRSAVRPPSLPRQTVCFNLNVWAVSPRKARKMIGAYSDQRATGLPGTTRLRS